MKQKTWYRIYLESAETLEAEAKGKQEIAKIKSKGIAYQTYQFYKENIYNRPTDKLTIE